MAALIALWLSCLCAYGAVNPTALGDQAISSLANREWSRAQFWADVLKKNDPQSALLYQLAWLQAKNAPAPKTRDAESQLSSGAQRWPWDGELWRDELENTKPGLDQEDPDLRSMPLSVVRGVIAPSLSRYSLLRSSTKTAVRAYLVAEWMADSASSSLILPKLNPADPDDLVLLALFDEAPRASVLDALLAEPRHFLGKAALFVKAGDLSLKSGDNKNALRDFESAIHEARGAPIPRKLWYRVAIASAKSGQNPDLMVRATFESLDPGLPDPALDSMYVSLLRLRFCAAFETLRADQASMLLSRNFTDQKRLPQSLELLSSCNTRHTLSVMNHLAMGLQNSHDQIEARKVLLLTALQLDDLDAASEQVRQLAIKSHSLPSLASQAFWSANRANPKFLEHLLRIYRKTAAWQDYDDDRFRLLNDSRRLRRGRGPSHEEAVLGLKAEESGHKSELQLGLDRTPPPLVFRTDIKVSFLKLFEDDLHSLPHARDQATK